ncbi:hypothetical protein [Allochromatium vinosum]|uniref:Uncharacterized protein n=1 Tax=Allochromatium vinosum (strain ATCC 17899 / DSM 180 / NBRC 103801 / NCIMB 10441 / D) TaxID=572477 RepID=D3RS59_ALLVD|nr:hypothetical protein [Allochromatium vinosum]ADC63996.1 hypothetical protein Alvin_3096 [Allochromatium vinosum DSM 180]
MTIQTFTKKMITGLDKLDAIATKFSKNQNRLLDKIQHLTGKEVAIALVGMQGVKNTSQAEIEVVANIISIFDTLTVENIEESPRSVVINGTYLKSYVVEIIPQYLSHKYSIDLVMVLYLSGRTVRIASLGVEYDGHDAHYIEHKIKKSYRRDSEILGSSGIPLIKLSPEQKDNLAETKKNIRKYFKHKIKEYEAIKTHTLSKCIRDNRICTERLTYVCLVCEGLGSLANVFCSECDGVGRTNNVNIDLTKHECFDCPDCKLTKARSCRTCLGRGWLDREKAIAWQRRHDAENT